MLRKTLLALALSTCALLTSSFGFGDNGSKFAIIDLQVCHEESLLAKEESKKLESLKAQLKQGLEEKEKEFKDMKQRFDDESFRESLSDDARKDFEGKMTQTLRDLDQYHNQLVRTLNQSGYEVAMSVLGSVESAAAKVAKAKGIDLVVRKELCLFYSPDFDVTKEVVATMDEEYNSKMGQASSAKQENASTAQNDKTKKKPTAAS